MQAQFDVVVLVGSLRKASYTRKLANVLIHMAPPSLRCRLVEIGGLPLYNQDLDIAPPNEWVDFRREVAKAHAVLILTPEYNRSVPGCLKNALDVGSRPPHRHPVPTADNLLRRRGSSLLQVRRHLAALSSNNEAGVRLPDRARQWRSARHPGVGPVP
jgi:NAD(P)H-dependent FMN reductase